MKHIGLFEGIGGFSLTAKMMGWETIAWCEIDPFCQKVLSYHFPNANKHGDIKQTDFSIYRGKCDIVTGGFPCQPFSTAGTRKGKDDSRYLWPEMLRAIREIQPEWIVGENVHGILNWSNGMVFEQVHLDLEVEGYITQAYVLPACGKNAPHRRERVWFVAHASSDGHRNEFEQVGREKGEDKSNGNKREWIRAEPKRALAAGSITKTENDHAGAENEAGVFETTKCSRQQGQGWPEESSNSETDSIWKASWSYDDGRWPTQSPLCGGDDGFSDRLDIGTISKKDWTEQGLKALGNAVVPQVVLEIFKAIESYTLHSPDPLKK